MAKRTKLINRSLPDYTRGEELFNMISHIVGGGISVVISAVCIVYSALFCDAWAVVSSAVYGASLILLYTMSSIYHGLIPLMAKKVFQVLDHCTIYFLIAGTYTPFTLCAIRRINPTVAWVIFGVVWALAALATTLTAIDLKKYATFSMICYIGMGWCIIAAGKITYFALTPAGFFYLLAGGIAYTVGAILYGLGKKGRYIHSVFHLFVILGSILHGISVLFYAL